MTSKPETLADVAIKNFELEICARRPILYICTHEEKRVMDEITALCRTKKKTTPWHLYTWDAAARLKNHLNPQITFEIPDKTTALLQWFDDLLLENNETAILVLKDFYKYLGLGGGNVGIPEHQAIRHLRNLSQKFLTVHKTIVLIGTDLYLPPELMKITKVLDWPLPEPFHIRNKVTAALNVAATRTADFPDFVLNYSDEEMDAIVRSFQGLVLEEIELTCTRMVLEHNKFSPSAIIAHKEEIIRKGGILEWLPPNVTLDMVGGLDGLKTWLFQRKLAFSQEARDYGLPLPKGMLLVGIPGAGKTLIAKAIANYWDVPLIRLDIGRIFAGIVGSSEANLRQAIKIAESMAPVVLLLDELDKAFSTSSRSDSGTTSRVMGEFLYWMQEKTTPVFLVSTANDISVLPPELLRKGRFDETFFVDLPTQEERLEIFKIHIQIKNRNLDDFNLDELALKSKFYTGAEIEACLDAAMHESFADNKREVTTKDILLALKSTVPLAYTMKENIVTLQNWAKERARSASGAEFVTKQITLTNSDNNSVPIKKVEDEDDWLKNMSKFLSGEDI